MIERRARLVTIAVLVTDQLVLATTYVASAPLMRSAADIVRVALPVGAPGLWPLALAAPLWTAGFLWRGLYRPRVLPSWRQETARVARAAAVSSLTLLMLAAAAMPATALPVLLGFSVLSGPAMLVTRRLVRASLLRAFGPRYVLVAGERTGVRTAAALVRQYAPWGVRLVGVAAEEPFDPGAGVEWLGPLEAVPRLVGERVVDDVVLVPDGAWLDPPLEAVVRALEEQGVTVRVLLDALPRRFAALSLDRLGATPLLTMAPAPQETWSVLARRLIEPLVALLFLIALSPLMLLIALAIKLTSPGPVLFRQTRCGLHGRPFTFLKFRSMYAGAERLQPVLAPLNEMDGPVFKMTRDPRVTPLGRVLRRTSLDELPQLWNIVRGEMSFVGPRPAVPEEVARYEPWQRRRLSVKPGLTGLWQVSGRSDLSFEGWIRLDLEYIDHRSFWEDCRILLRTIPAVLRGRGAW